MLRFEPKCWYVGDMWHLARTPKNSIKLAATDNICVVCGKSTDYVCHSILPHKYRKYLPEVWKSHNNHDNVILCVDSLRRGWLDRFLVRFAVINTMIFIVVEFWIVTVSLITACQSLLIGKSFRHEKPREFCYEYQMVKFVLRMNVR